MVYINIFLLHSDQSHGEYQLCLKKCDRGLSYITRQLHSDLPKRDEFEATFYSFTGNAHFELGNFDLALRYHNRDLEIAEKL